MSIATVCDMSITVGRKIRSLLGALKLSLCFLKAEIMSIHVRMFNKVSMFLPHSTHFRDGGCVDILPEKLSERCDL